MVTGKVGTDIEERKCSWLVVQALQRISAEQMQILKVMNPVIAPPPSPSVKGALSHLMFEYHFKELKKLRFNVSPQIMVWICYKRLCYYLKLFAVACCFDSEGTKD